MHPGTLEVLKDALPSAFLGGVTGRVSPGSFSPLRRGDIDERVRFRGIFGFFTSKRHKTNSSTCLEKRERWRRGKQPSRPHEPSGGEYQQMRKRTCAWRGGRVV